MSVRRQIFKVLKYLVMLGLAVALLWWVFRKIEIDDFITRLSEVNYLYVIISIILGFVSYWIRGYRWTLMFEPLGHHLAPYRSFLAVNVGYLANLALPRMGEITRCGVLKRTDNIKISVSIGTVIAERVIDLLTLLFITILGLFVEYELLSQFLFDLFEQSTTNKNSGTILFAGSMIILVALVGLWFFRRRLFGMSWFIKARDFLLGLKSGLSSVLKIKRQFLFWLSTIALWTTYFIMTYIVMFALPETSGLLPAAGLTILVTGSFGMVAPVQGGIGAFHLFVSSTLVLYGINLTDGLVYATLLHSSQLIGIVLVGGASLFVTLFLRRRNQTTS